MVEPFQWYSLLSVGTSAVALGLAGYVLKRTPNRPAANQFVTAMVFFLLAAIFAYLLRASFSYYGPNVDAALFYARLFYFFHMLAVGFTAAFVGSYFYGFQIMGRRFVNLELQISLLVIAIVVSAQVTEVELEGAYGVVIESRAATLSLAVASTAYMLTAVLAIIRTLVRNKDAIVRRQSAVMLAGILVHGAAAESYAYLRIYADSYPPPILTATALLMAASFAFAIARYKMFVVTPKKEEPIPVPAKFPVKAGHAYLVPEKKPDLSLRALSEAAHHGSMALIISRAPPDTVREDFDLEGSPILWLTATTGQNHVPPTHLDLLEDLVLRFAAEWEHAVVAIDGLEYLMVYHDFGRLMRSLHKMRDAVTGKGGVFLVSANPSSMEDREAASLDREFERLPVPSTIQTVEDVFLIHESGLLISHATRRLKPETDRDTMAGMLTAIMSFARVSFSEGEGELRRLELGPKTVVLERGENIILAVVFNGPTPPEVDSELRAFLYRAERRYGAKLEKWNGAVDEVKELHAMAQKMVGRLLA
ncbi:MAG TPA: DUF835 domain-containing protein [Thermoplasmata archaeon]|jgi:hypothetical protein|nr:DUF835 domain-containing protein [Thermoplasmata archaeon]